MISFERKISDNLYILHVKLVLAEIVRKSETIPIENTLIFKTSSIETIVISKSTCRARFLLQPILGYRVEVYLVCSRLLLGLLFIMSDEKLHGKLAREAKRCFAEWH